MSLWPRATRSSRLRCGRVSECSGAKARALMSPMSNVGMSNE